MAKAFLRAHRATALAPFFTLLACGNSAVPTPDGGSPEDATSVEDTGADHHVGKDAGPDASKHLDAGHDGSADAHVSVDAPTHVDASGDAPQSADVVVADTSTPVDAGVDSGPVLFDAGFYDAGPPALRYIGRIDYSDPNGPQFEWPGTQVIARFTGPAINVQMNDYGNYFNVIVDGVLQPTPILGSGTQTDYPLASGLTSSSGDGIHEVILYRRTEADVSTTQITGVTFPQGGALVPQSPPSARKLEVIGDSISCGYGTLGPGPNCDGTNEQEDHYDSYEAVTARALSADLITTAWSGEGMFQNYDDSTAEPPLPGLYPYILPGEQTGMWDFTSWVPDAVVINLGTNDFWNGDPTIAYETAYVTFLKTVRGHYPNAYIIAANGPLLESGDFMTAEAYIKGAIAQRNTAGDTNIAYLSFGIQDGTLGYGCDYHPTPAEHAKMATALEAALTSALGW